MAFKYEHYAARFAAKEAFLKAIGTGWRSGTAFNEIEIYNDEEESPKCVSYKAIPPKTVAKLNAGKIFVSLSHLKTMACTMVLIEALTYPHPILLSTAQLARSGHAG